MSPHFWQKASPEAPLESGHANLKPSPWSKVRRRRRHRHRICHRTRSHRCSSSPHCLPASPATPPLPELGHNIRLPQRKLTGKQYPWRASTLPAPSLRQLRGAALVGVRKPLESSAGPRLKVHTIAASNAQGCSL